MMFHKFTNKNYRWWKCFKCSCNTFHKTVYYYPEIKICFCKDCFATEPKPKPDDLDVEFKKIIERDEYYEARKTINQ